jgi:hypothetical protein
MRNEEHRADDAQDIELIEQIEFVGKRHRGSPRVALFARPRSIKFAFPGV